jgi:agmatine deiminase
MPTLTPRDAGFAMPAEWGPHAGTFMAWPCRPTVWPARMAAARTQYAGLAREIARFETLTMIANPADAAEARATCGPTVEVLEVPIDDSWARDSGPSLLRNAAGALAGVAWRFNAWGNKHLPYDNDAKLASALIAHLGIPRFNADFVLEGGAIHVDGEGTLLTTEQCLLHPNRNPHLTRAAIEENLCAWLGISSIIWLGEGLENDETDGHVDDIACFAAPGVVIAAVCADHSDPNHAPLDDNLRRLRAARDARGRALSIVELPLPARREVPGVGRLASSYVNFYLANGAVLVPVFNDPNDAPALAILRDVFADREVVAVPADVIIEGGGSVHCITQQIPAGTIA